MANLDITNNAVSGVALVDPVFSDESLTFSGAETSLAGTILARDTSTMRMVPYVIGGSTNGNGIPKAILTQDVIALGAGNVACRPALSGQVRRSQIVINADGDNSNLTKAIEDQLLDFGLIVLSTNQLSELDNQ